MYPPGTTLKLDYGTFYHYGIADGLGGVIHNSKKLGKVTHESEAEIWGQSKIYLSWHSESICIGTYGLFKHFYFTLTPIVVSPELCLQYPNRQLMLTY